MKIQSSEEKLYLFSPTQGKAGAFDEALLHNVHRKGDT